MYSGGVLSLLGLGIIIWLGILSYFFLRERQFLHKLFPRSDQDQGNEATLLVRQKFDELLKAVEEIGRREQSLNKNFRDLARLNLGHIQRVGVSRYNPYSDTGGDQSFSVALLDGNLNGVVLTSLHSRSGTRVYAKSIKNGKSDLELSREEKEVVQKVINE